MYFLFFFKRENGSFRLLIIFNYIKGVANCFRCHPLTGKFRCTARRTGKLRRTERQNAMNPLSAAPPAFTPNPALVKDLVADLLAEELCARQARAAGRAPGRCDIV